MSKQKWPIQPNKLCVGGFSPNLSDSDLRAFCEEFGTFVLLYRTQCKTQVFLTYLNETAAAIALQKFRDKVIRANYAYDKRNANSNGSSSSKESPAAIKSNGVHFPFEDAKENSNGIKKNSNGVKENSNQKSKGITFRSGEEVIITHVKGTSEFYARPKAMDNEYKSLIKMVAESVKTAERLNHFPIKREWVLAPYEADFRRGIMQNDVKNKNELAVVYLLDYGVTIEVPCEKLRVCPKDLNIPRLTYKFHLDGCTFDTNNFYAEQCFKTLIGATFKMEHDKPSIEQRTHVRLIDTETFQSINDLIKQMQAPKFTVKQLVFNSPPVGTNKSVVVIDSTKLTENRDNLITLCDKKMQLQYYRQRNRINDVAKIFERFPEYMPTVDELCMVKFNNYWYRALFVEKYYKTAQVLLLDIQKGVEVPLKNIRKIINDFVAMPILTFTVMVCGQGVKITDEKFKRLIGIFKSDEAVNAKFIGIDPKTADRYLIEV